MIMGIFTKKEHKFSSTFFYITIVLFLKIGYNKHNKEFFQSLPEKNAMCLSDQSGGRT